MASATNTHHTQKLQNPHAQNRQDLTKILADDFLPLIQSRCDEWIASLKSPNIDKIYSAIKSGKMLRSKLIFAILGQRLSNPKSTNPTKSSNILESAIDLCAVIELVQCASLLHDDVIDEAKTRRGVPSVNATFGNKNAIMLGDVLYSKAYFHLADFPLSIAKSVSNAVCALSRGEIDDVLYSSEFQPSLEVYYKILEDKTASLIASSAESSAILAGLDSLKYYEYGKNLGLAFQIVDDLLDITQDEATLGKPSMNDLREGKSTLPYILLYDEIDLTKDFAKKEEFLSHFYKRDSVAIEWFKKSFDTYKIIEKTQKIAQDFIAEALNAIKDEQNPTLEQIATSMIDRRF
ncbi:polyprenyl synthetase family protein [Helicobacter sp. T3_23-1056]